jgi:hypothetical protein
LRPTTLLRIRNCLRKRSRSLRFAAVWKMQFSAGEMNSRLAAVTWQTPAGYGLYDTAGNVFKWTRTGIRAIMRTKWKSLVAYREDRTAARGTELRSGAACGSHPAQSHQRRLPSTRGHLLPQIPASDTASADGEHQHVPYRVPVSRPDETEGEAW